MNNPTEYFFETIEQALAGGLRLLVDEKGHENLVHMESENAYTVPDVYIRGKYGLADVKNQTTKAIQVGKRTWLPKSQIRLVDGVYYLKFWLARKVIKE